ncbi:MAG TPA: hypothetical protein VLR94_01320, partial [Acidobacteriota bacterium]|nr:hypothetical protein [Acidobacteriota bacterium]
MGVGSVGSSSPSSVPAAQTPDVDQTQKTSQPDTTQNPESAKASQEHATQQMGERNLESSVRETEIRASLNT